MAPTTDRQAFRTTLAQAAEQARLLLPQAVNGRIESAVRLVLQADVVFNRDGTVTVGSSSDPMKTHTIAGATCDCQDFVHGKGTEGWCQHRIAANLQRSVERVLARRGDPEPAPAVVLPEPMEPYPDNDSEGEPEPLPAPAPLPEAPASVNCHLTIGGRQVQLTLRGVSEDEVLTRLERVLARYPVPQTPAPQLSPQQLNAMAMHRPVAGVCPLHQVQMQENEKEGRRWFSHRTAEGWCKGR